MTKAMDLANKLANLFTRSVGLSAAEQLQGRQNLGVPTPQANSKDATAGRSLLVGAFGLGLGTYAPGDDANLIVNPGQYLLKSHPDGKNWPDGAWWTIDHYGEDGNGQAWQEANRLTGGADAKETDKRRRRKSVGAWGPWKRVEPTWERISTVNADDLNAVVFTDIGDFDTLRLTYSIVPPPQLANYGVQFSKDNGVSWVSDATSYRGAGYYANQTAAATGVNFASLAATSYIELGTNVSNQQMLVGSMLISAFKRAGRASTRASGGYSLLNSGTGEVSRVTYDFTGECMDGAPMNALRVFASQSRVFDGVVALEGIRL